ncbi:MAG: acetate/propionate family kinase, partial [Silvanigrellaceae bacterium]|nr:acetate/propionate family kinase [Silvanigrellaceae bacterium]
IPEVNYLYAIPYPLYRRLQVRRYGFHGTSHRYVSQRYAKITHTPVEKLKMITIHLGNGCSACAILNGKSFDTSMGFTPMEGLMMGTRCGNLDVGAAEHIMQKEGMSISELDQMLNKQSGLLGISGLTNDMRELLEEEERHEDRRVSLAIDMFCKKVKYYIGAYCALMDGADAIVFTGGIGENASKIREKICAEMSFFGITIDKGKNEKTTFKKEGEISTHNSKLKIWVIPTNEELIIARDTYECIEQQQPGKQAEKF